MHLAVLIFRCDDAWAQEAFTATVVASCYEDEVSLGEGLGGDQWIESYGSCACGGGM